MNVNKIDYEPRDWAESSRRKAGYRQTLKIGNVGYGFVWIPAGEFDMGSPESEKGREDHEKLHHVKLTKGFWMLETEVPQTLYQEVMGTNPSYFKGDDFPVECVSWDDATKFCEKLTTLLSVELRKYHVFSIRRLFRPRELKANLPTEAQWEYSCRAGTKTAYWYGDIADSRKMNNDKSETTSVKSYDPNPWGLYDMHGNVFEWTSDYYGDYPSETVVDPQGPSNALNRVLRSGCCDCPAELCRSVFRAEISSDRRNGGLGFRFLLRFN